MEAYKYICEKCNYKTNLRHLLEQHNNTVLHLTGKRKQKPIKIKKIYECDKCNYKTSNNNNYSTHRLNNHDTQENREKEFTFYCKKCDFGVFTESSYNIHLTTKKHLMKQNN